jgi:hypothetical protein
LFFKHFRILEFEVNGIDVGDQSVTAEVELWDVSGDHKYVMLCQPRLAEPGLLMSIKVNFLSFIIIIITKIMISRLVSKF